MFGRGRKSGRIGRVQSGTLVVYDGEQFTAYDDVRRSDVNTLLFDGGEVSVDLVRVVRPGLYVYAADELQLLKETDFHSARRRVIFASLFQNNTDIMEFARQAALWVQLAVTLLTWFSVQSVSGSVTHLQTLIK